MSLKYEPASEPLHISAGLAPPEPKTEEPEKSESRETRNSELETRTPKSWTVNPQPPVFLAMQSPRLKTT